MNQGSKKTRFLFFLLFFLVVFFMVVVPIIAKYVAIEELKKLGANEVEIHRISFNPFRGSIGLEGLRLKDDKQQELVLNSLSINASFLALFSKQILIQSVELDGLDVSVLKKGDNIWLGLPIDLSPEQAEPVDSELPGETEEPAFDWGVGLASLKLSNIKFNYSEGDFAQQLDIDYLVVNDVYSWQADQESEVAAELKLQGRPIKLEATALPFAEIEVVKLNLTADKLVIEPYQAFLSDKLDSLKGLVSLTQAIEVSINENSEIRLSSVGSFAVEQVSFRNLDGSIPLQTLKQFDLAWQGKLDAKLNASQELAGLTVDGLLNNSALALDLDQPPISVKHGGVRWQGAIDLAGLEIEKGLTMAADAAIENLSITSVDSSLNILELTKADFSQIKIAGLDKIELGGVGFSGLSMLALSKPDTAGSTDDPDSKINTLLQVSAINAETLSVWNMKDLALKSLSIDGLNADIFIDGSQSIAQLDALQSVLGSSESSDVNAEQTVDTGTAVNNVGAVNNEGNNSKPGPKTDQSAEGGAVVNNTEPVPVNEAAQPDITLRLDSFEIIGDSAIQFEDDSIQPNFKRKLLVNTFTINNIEWAGTAQELDVNIDLGMDDDSSVRVKGVATPIPDNVSAQLQVNIADVRLVPVSPYLRESTGYKVKTGTLNLDSNVKIVSHQLEVTNTIMLNAIELTPHDKEKLEKLAAELTMPLDYALGLLRDKNGNVELKVPVTGALDSPDFSVNDVLRIAMKKALRVASLHYLKNMLAPYGTALTIAQFVGKQVTKIRIDPVIFEPASSALSEEAQNYLSTIASKLLADKPDLRLKVCAVSTPADSLGAASQTAEELNATLLKLSQARATAVNDFFKYAEIEAQRLIDCGPSVEKDEKAKPRVELSI